MTADKSDQSFCDGLTEELSNWLAQIPTLARRGPHLRLCISRAERRCAQDRQGTRHKPYPGRLDAALGRSDAGHGAARRCPQGLSFVVGGFRPTSDDTIKIQEDISRSVGGDIARCGSRRILNDSSRQDAWRPWRTGCTCWAALLSALTAESPSVKLIYIDKCWLPNPILRRRTPSLPTPS